MFLYLYKSKKNSNRNFINKINNSKNKEKMHSFYPIKFPVSARFITTRVCNRNKTPCVLASWALPHSALALLQTKFVIKPARASGAYNLARAGKPNLSFTIPSSLKVSLRSVTSLLENKPQTSAHSGILGLSNTLPINTNYREELNFLGLRTNLRALFSSLQNEGITSKFVDLFSQQESNTPFGDVNRTEYKDFGLSEPLLNHYPVPLKNLKDTNYSTMCKHKYYLENTTSQLEYILEEDSEFIPCLVKGVKKQMLEIDRVDIGVNALEPLIPLIKEQIIKKKFICNSGGRLKGLVKSNTDLDKYEMMNLGKYSLPELALNSELSLKELYIGDPKKQTCVASVIDINNKETKINLRLNTKNDEIMKGTAFLVLVSHLKSFKKYGNVKRVFIKNLFDLISFTKSFKVTKKKAESKKYWASWWKDFYFELKKN